MTVLDEQSGANGSGCHKTGAISACNINRGNLSMRKLDEL